jgi:hypothetical protein
MNPYEIDVKRQFSSNINFDKKILFIHIPKCAGTSFSKALYGNQILHTTAKQFKKYFPGSFEKLFKFTIIRSPIERTISAYNFIKSSGSKDVSIDYKIIYESKAFDNFENFVKIFLSKKENLYIDNIFRPQCDFIFENNKLILDYVGIIDNLKEVLIMLESKGHRINLEHINKQKITFLDQKEINEELRKQIINIYQSDWKLYNKIKNNEKK